MQKIFLLFIIFAFTLTSCEKIAKQIKSSTTDENSITSYVDVDEVTSFGFPGTYEGIIPCKDCKGVVTTLKLSKNNSYELLTKEIEKKDTIHESGSFSFDPSTSVLTTMPMDTTYFSKHFEITPDQVYFLGNDKKRFYGELADLYILKKK